MIRTSKKKEVSCILTGDWHLRVDTPICRTDDFEAAQWKKVLHVKQLQEQFNCPVLHSGDLFNHWKPSPYLLSKTMDYLPAQFHTIYGNHDLPQHSLQEADKCGIFVLWKAGKLKILDGTHWGDVPTKHSICIKEKKILIWHVMTYQTKKPWPGCTDAKAGRILHKYPGYDLILTGHNHQAFIEEYENRILVNPGSLTRQNADQVDFQPRVYFYYTDTNSVEPVYLPIEVNVVSKEHLQRDVERSDRIDAFISKLDGEWQAGLSFESNMEEFFKNNRTRKQTKEIIYKALEV